MVTRTHGGGPPGRAATPGRAGGRAGTRAAGVLSAVLVSALLAGASAGCATSAPRRAGAGTLSVIAAENTWGSLAAQLGGDRVRVTSIVDRPGADPHDYEPTAADARAVATATLIIVNGLGYDPWASRLDAANPGRGRTRLDIGALVGAPAGSNPHRWYSPADVRTVIDAITAAYQSADPAGAEYYGQLHDTLLGTGMRRYFDLIAQIRARFAGTLVGASESIFAMLAPALGLDLLTPAAFLAAISQGNEPTAADKATIDAQIATGAIQVYVYNSQNATPDIQAQVAAATAAGIPVATITETPTPAGATFQDWQADQLAALAGALAAGTGR